MPTPTKIVVPTAPIDPSRASYAPIDESPISVSPVGGSTPDSATPPLSPSTSNLGLLDAKNETLMDMVSKLSKATLAERLSQNASLIAELIASPSALAIVIQRLGATNADFETKEHLMVSDKLYCMKTLDDLIGAHLITVCEKQAALRNQILSMSNTNLATSIVSHLQRMNEPQIARSYGCYI